VYPDLVYLHSGAPLDIMGWGGTDEMRDCVINPPAATIHTSMHPLRGIGAVSFDSDHRRAPHFFCTRSTKEMVALMSLWRD